MRPQQIRLERLAVALSSLGSQAGPLVARDRSSTSSKCRRHDSALHVRSTTISQEVLGSEVERLVLLHLQLNRCIYRLYCVTFVVVHERNDDVLRRWHHMRLLQLLLQWTLNDGYSRPRELLRIHNWTLDA